MVKWEWKWLENHPRLSAVVAMTMLVAGGLATIQANWNLFSNEPLFPYLAQTVPLWPRIVLMVVFACLIMFGIILLVKVFRQTAKEKATNAIHLEPVKAPTQSLAFEDYTEYPKAEASFKIPSSPLTPAVNIHRAAYVEGEGRILRVAYVAGTAEVLSSFEREAKLRLQQGDFQTDILPVNIEPNMSGTFAGTADYRIPESLRGKVVVTPIVIVDGCQVNSQPFTIDL